jgi:hypothetical protein
MWHRLRRCQRPRNLPRNRLSDAPRGAGGVPGGGRVPRGRRRARAVRRPAPVFVLAGGGKHPRRRDPVRARRGHRVRGRPGQRLDSIRIARYSRTWRPRWEVRRPGCTNSILRGPGPDGTVYALPARATVTAITPGGALKFAHYLSGISERRIWRWGRRGTSGSFRQSHEPGPCGCTDTGAGVSVAGFDEHTTPNTATRTGRASRSWATWSTLAAPPSYTPQRTTGGGYVARRVSPAVVWTRSA